MHFARECVTYLVVISSDSPAHNRATKRDIPNQLNIRSRIVNYSVGIQDICLVHDC